MISALERMVQEGRQEERQEVIMKLVKAGFNQKKMEKILKAK